MSRFVKLLFCVITTGLMISAVPKKSVADDNAKANLLYIEAIRIWEKANADGLAPDQRLELAKEVSQHLEKIVSEYPGTMLALYLTIEKSVRDGPVGGRRVAKAIERQEECLSEPDRNGCDDVRFLMGGRYLPNKPKPAEPKAIRIVAVRKELRAGQELTYEIGKEVLQFVEWPESAVPASAFQTAVEIFGREKKWVRTITMDLEPGELLLLRSVSKASSPVSEPDENDGRVLFPLPANEGDVSG